MLNVAVPFRTLKVPVQTLERKGRRQAAIRNDEVVSVEWAEVALDCDKLRQSAMSSNSGGALQTDNVRVPFRTLKVPVQTLGRKGQHQAATGNEQVSSTSSA